MTEVSRGQFALFVKNKATILQVSSDSTPMRLSTSPIGSAGSLEVYARSITARAPDGEEMKYIPELILPVNSTAAGVMSSIMIKDLFIEELMSRPGFRVLLLVMDGIPTNRAAARMLVSELQIYPELLVLTSLCTSHTLSLGTKWGLGTFPYGKYLRTAHGLEAVRCRNFKGHAQRMIRGGAPLLNEPLVQSDTFLDYVSAIQDEYRAPIAAQEHIDSPRQLLPDGRPPIHDIWKKFTRLVIGQRGPFQRKPKRNHENDLASRCFELWPLGPPMRGEFWYCPPGKSVADYTSVISELFGYSIPVPVSSRWYNV